MKKAGKKSDIRKVSEHVLMMNYREGNYYVCKLINLAKKKITVIKHPA